MATELREVTIEEYWPLIVKNTEEFGQIAVAENPEFNKLAECIYRVLQDSFVRDATEYGVGRWEKILNLTPESGDTLDDRKARILTYLNIKLPYTVAVLRQMLIGLLGEENFTMSINNDTATLTITLSAYTTQAQINDVESMLERVLPMNLVKETIVKEVPDDYTRLDFLESTGTQHLDTGITLSNESEVRVVFVQPYYTGANQYIFGASNRSGIRNYSILAESELRPDRVYAYCVGVDSSMMYWGNAQEFGKKRNMYISAAYAELDGVPRNNPIIPAAFDTCSAYLFARNHEGGGIARGVSRIYSVAIANQTAPQANYVPILTAEGVPAMWDSVSKTTKYNDGTGSFVAGMSYEQALKLADLPETTDGALTISIPANDSGEVYSSEIKTMVDAAKVKGWDIIIRAQESDIPTEYTRLEYLESTGSQYINTGYLPSGDTDFFTITFSETRLNDTWAPVFGTSINDNNGFYLRLAGYRNAASGRFQYRYQGRNLGWENLGVNVLETNTFTFQNNVLSINGKSVATLDSSDFSLPDPVILYGMWNGTGPWGMGRFRIHNFEIGQNDTKAVKYIPCLDNAGTPCMYDTVTRTPFYNAGTGKFIAGIETKEQLNFLLQNLPDRTGQTVGTLQIRLADELKTDENIATLDAMYSKNWEISQAS